jgi:hypothetical protein
MAEDNTVVDAKRLRSREVSLASYHRNAEKRNAERRERYRKNIERERENARNRYQKVGGEEEKRGRKRIDQSQTQPQE